MNQFNKTIIVSFFFLVGCSAIFEKSINDKTVKLIAPKDSLISDKFDQFFYWEEVEHALGYHLQVAHPNFDNIQTLLLDTNVESTSFEFSLAPGNYQWRVMAYNGSSETGYSVNLLTIDSNPDLSSQTITLISPSSGVYSNDSVVTFNWKTLSVADDYQFKLKSPDFNGSDVIPAVITTDTAITKVLEEGAYGWGVRGQNFLSNTLFSSRTLTIDYTPPAKPVLVTPIDNDSISSGTAVNFQWSTSQDNGSPIIDSLYISTDSLDWTSSLAYSSSTLEFTVDSLSIGNYFWKVISVDAAGNSSVESDSRKITVQ